MTTATLAPTFDVARAHLEDYLDGTVYPPRLILDGPYPVQTALQNNLLHPTTPLLLFEVAGARLAVPLDLGVSFSVMQGNVNGTPWLLTFCNACNTGMAFNPTLDGRALTFRRRGAYDGMLLIFDDETQTYWQHISGRALHGPSAGARLAQHSVTTQMSAAKAHAMYPDLTCYTVEMSPRQVRLTAMLNQMRVEPTRNEAGIAASIGPEEDTRLPRFELGLGVWKDEDGLFVPVTALHAAHNALVLPFAGGRLAVFQEEDALAPSAFTTQATEAHWQADVLRLNDGTSVRNGVLYAADGTRQTAPRPAQLLVRWFGFALTFPGCAIYRA